MRNKDTENNPIVIVTACVGGRDTIMAGRLSVPLNQLPSAGDWLCLTEAVHVFRYIKKGQGGLAGDPTLGRTCPVDGPTTWYVPTFQIAGLIPCDQEMWERILTDRRKREPGSE